MKSLTPYLFSCILCFIYNHSIAQQVLEKTVFTKAEITIVKNGEHLKIGVEPGEIKTNNWLNVEYIKEENKHKVMLKANSNLEVKSVKLFGTFNPLYVKKVFCNGYQCWTNSREYNLYETQEAIKGILKGAATHYGDYGFYNYSEKKGYLHSWTYSYMRRDPEHIELIASLNEQTGFTVINYKTIAQKIIVEKEVEGLILKAGETYEALNIFQQYNTDELAFENYKKELATSKPYLSTAKPATGWTSWYNYYTKINEDIILDNLYAFSEREVPINIFQIDDGYQKSVGEWTKANDKFPKGMSFIADEVHKMGYKAGIWLAPFVAEKKSPIYKKHPDWFVKNEKGKHLVVGYNPGWSGKYYALDIYNSEVQNYLENTFDTIFNIWNYDMVKLDFLFAAAILPRHGKTRGEIMSDGIELLRKWAGDKWILGCGVPLGSSFGQVDYCRIGSDIHMKWEFSFLERMNAQERLSVWNAMTSNIARRQLSGNFFYNDTDVYVLRKENNKLTSEEKFTTFLVNNIFGELILTSDNINNYDDKTLKLYLSSFPQLKKSNVIVQKLDNFYRVNFTVNGRNYLAFINLSDNSETAALDDADAYNSSEHLIHRANSFITIKPHQSICFYLIEGIGVELLGGKGHLFSGSEVKKFNVNANNIEITYQSEAINRESIYILIPKSFSITIVNGKHLEPINLNGKRAVVYQPK